MKTLRFIIQAMLAALFLSACASSGGQGVVWQDPEVDRVWPEPPEKPRIRLAQVVDTSEDFTGKNKGSQLFGWLTGGDIDDLELYAPYGIAADGRGRVWVSDPGSGNVLMFSLENYSVSGFNQAGASNLLAPTGIVYDTGRQRLLVSDGGLKKVFEFDDRLRFRREIVYPKGFGRPGGIAVDADGRVYVADVTEGQVVVFSADGAFERVIGSKASADGRFSHPSNVVVDGAGRIYVVDSLRFRVEIQAADGTLLGTIGGIGDSSGSFARPRGIGVDSSGHIYVADAAFDNIQIFDLVGNLLLYFGAPGDEPGEFCLPAGLFIDSNDRIYVAESCNQRFQIFEYLP